MAKKKRKGKRKNSIPLHKQIMRLVVKHDTGVHYKKVIKKFIGTHIKIEITDAIKLLVRKGKVTQDDRGQLIAGSHQYGQNDERKITGKVDMTRSGSAFIITEQFDDDVFVAAQNLNTAWNGDEVEVELFKRRGKRREGEVTKICKRFQEQFIGKLQILKHTALIPVNRGPGFSVIQIPLDQVGKAKDGDHVLVEVTEWAGAYDDSKGGIIEVLKKDNWNDLSMKSILLESGFSLQFPSEVMREAERFNLKIDEKELENRLDLRKVMTFTIDPADAKDFDDAISYQELDDGSLEVGVHIADVSHYVPEGSALDKEAYKRATSVYLVDRVCPMFPEHLSNFVCSLRPKEEKFCFSVMFTFDQSMKMTNASFARTVIYSDKRFAYEDAQKLIESGRGQFGKALKRLNEIAGKLRKERFKNGSINFETTEFRFELNEEGKPIGIKMKERQDAHLLIEDFMLLANKTVAKFLSKPRQSKKDQAAVYRVHDSPDREKLENLRKIAARFGYPIRFHKPAQIADAINGLVDKINGKPEQRIIEQMAIRSMAKAHYTTKNIGHFGLAFEHYTHFTSPIRRYPDVMVHRLLAAAMSNQNKAVARHVIEEQSQHCSVMERNAQKAERESTRLKQVEYMEQRLGEEFDGIISGVISRGIFVELLENHCEGFVPTESLGEEDFLFDESDLMLVGTRTKRKFQLGDLCKVKAVSTDYAMRRVELDLVNHGNER